MFVFWGPPSWDRSYMYARFKGLLHIFLPRNMIIVNNSHGTHQAQTFYFFLLSRKSLLFILFSFTWGQITSTFSQHSMLSFAPLATILVANNKIFKKNSFFTYRKEIMQLSIARFSVRASFSFLCQYIVQEFFQQESMCKNFSLVLFV